MINTGSPDWIAVDKWARAELHRLRERNDSSMLDPVETAFLRGEISRLKRLLELPSREDREIIVVEEPPYL